MITATSDNINELMNAECAVLDFWASWCGPCRMLSPTVEALAEKYEGKVVFGSVNVDEQEELATRFGISVIPTLFFLKKGSVFQKTVGVRSRSELEGTIEQMLSE